MSKHTPIPWTFDDIWHLIKGPNGEEVAAIHSAQASDTARRGNRFTANANAEFIVRACNNHDKLVAALAMCIAVMEDPPSVIRMNDTDGYRNARAALADATKETP